MSVLTLMNQGFYDPVNERMFEPSLTGFSYSFTDDGHYEVAYYRAGSNRITHSLRESFEVVTDLSHSGTTKLSIWSNSMATRKIYQSLERFPCPHTFCRGRSTTHLRPLLVS